MAPAARIDHGSVAHAQVAGRANFQLNAGNGATVNVFLNQPPARNGAFAQVFTEFNEEALAWSEEWTAKAFAPDHARLNVIVEPVPSPLGGGETRLADEGEEGIENLPVLVGYENAFGHDLNGDRQVDDREPEASDSDIVGHHELRRRPVEDQSEPLNNTTNEISNGVAGPQLLHANDVDPNSVNEGSDVRAIDWATPANRRDAGRMIGSDGPPEPYSGPQEVTASSSEGTRLDAPRAVQNATPPLAAPIYSLIPDTGNKKAREELAKPETTMRQASTDFYWRPFRHPAALPYHSSDDYLVQGSAKILLLGNSYVQSKQHVKLWLESRNLSYKKILDKKGLEVQNCYVLDKACQRFCGTKIEFHFADNAREYSELLKAKAAGSFIVLCFNTVSQNTFEDTINEV